MQPLAWPPSFLTSLPQSGWPLCNSGFTQQPVILFRICGPRVALLLTPLRGSHCSGIRPKLPDWSGSADLGSSLSQLPVSPWKAPLCLDHAVPWLECHPQLSPHPPAALDFSVSWLREGSRIPGPCPDSTDKYHLLLQLLVKTSFLPLTTSTNSVCSCVFNHMTVGLKPPAAPDWTVGKQTGIPSWGGGRGGGWAHLPTHVTLQQGLTAVILYLLECYLTSVCICHYSVSSTRKGLFSPPLSNY